jgi:hypothetical protein
LPAFLPAGGRPRLVHGEDFGDINLQSSDAHPIGVTALRALAFVALVALLACRPAETGGIDRSTFIDVMVQLREAAREFPDSAAFDARRHAILVEASLTDSALNAFVVQHNADAHFMAEVWDSVDRRINPTEAAVPDTVRDDP